MKSLLFKHFIVTALLILVSFVALGAMFITLSNNYISDDKLSQLTRNAGIVSRSATLYVQADRMLFDWPYRISVSAVANVSDAHILICDKSGVVLVCSDTPPCPHLGMKINKNIMRAALGGGYSATGDLDGIYPPSSLTVGVPIVVGGGNAVGVTFATAELSEMSKMLSNFMRLFGFTAIMVLVFAYLSTYFAARRMTRPLKIMANAAHQFAHGNFSARVPEKHMSSEIGELSSAFNVMADALQKSEELRRSFIGNVSHELRTPMTTIAGFIEGILDGTVPEDKRDEYMTIIRDEVYRLSRLAKRMLEIARMQSGEMEPTFQDFDVGELVSRTLFGFESRVESKNLDVELDLPPSPLQVHADSDMITQVVFNLLDNAVKFADHGSVLGISVSRSLGRASVSIRNTGPTIPADDLVYIFGRFHKIDRSRAQDRDGVGLGLYIVKMILDSHNQDISVTSADGVTTFTFTLALKN